MSDPRPAYDASRAALDPERVDRIVQRLWSADEGSAAPVGDGANAVFRFACAGREHFLKLYDVAQTPEPLVASATDLLAHLARCGVEVCRPVPSIAGQLVERARELPGFAATAVDRVPGEPIGPARDEPGVYTAWGRSLARLHEAAARYDPDEPRSFTTADAIWSDVEARLPDDAVVRAEFARIDAWRGSLPRDAEAMGLTHSDCRADNAFWDGARVWIIDFDEPVYDWCAADVARPFLELTERRVAVRPALQAAFVRGYRSVRALDERWLHDLPWFGRLKDLERYTWVLARWAGDVVPGGERRDAFLARMRAAFTELDR